MVDTHLLIYPLLLAVLVGIASLLARWLPFYRELYARKLENPRFEAHLEGLRGLLAINVFFHHAAYTFRSMQVGRWELPDSHLMHLLGKGSVSLFFFLSGYLFWMALRRAPEKPVALGPFYRLRFLRIAPLYLAYCLFLFALVGAKTGWTLHVPPDVLASGVAQWLVFGVPLGLFPDLNAYRGTALVNAGVAWSLRHEVQFYALVPFLRFFAAGHRTLWLIPLFGGLWVASCAAVVVSEARGWETTALLLAEGLRNTARFLLTGFLPGMLTAYLKTAPFAQRHLGLLRGRSGAALLALSLAVLLLSKLVAIKLMAIKLVAIKLVAISLVAMNLLALWVVFLCVVLGEVGRRLLSTRAFFFLGVLSYGIYLVHGVFLYALTPRGLGLYPRLMGAPELLPFWSLVPSVGLVLLLCTAATYRWIEHVGIEWARRG